MLSRPPRERDQQHHVAVRAPQILGVDALGGALLHPGEVQPVGELDSAGEIADQALRRFRLREQQLVHLVAAARGGSLLGLRRRLVGVVERQDVLGLVRVGLGYVRVRLNLMRLALGIARI